MPGLCKVGCRLTNNTSPSTKWRYTRLPGWDKLEGAREGNLEGASEVVRGL